MAFGLPMGFVTNGSDHKQAQTQDGNLYDVSGTIQVLQQGVRYSLTLAQLVSFETMRRIKAATRCTLWLRRLTGAQAADDFENLCINQLRRVSPTLAPKPPKVFFRSKRGLLLTSARQRLAKGPGDRPQKDFVSKIVDDREGKSRCLPFRQLVAESIVFMNAGSDTTAAALSSTLYFLLSNPHCLAKLREEVETKIDPGDPRSIIPYDLVRELPYLRACIDESLRLRPPIAYPLQRLVTSPEGATIAGHTVKQGTVVAVPPYTIHRNKTLYRSPEAYDPDRWFDSEQIQNLKKYNVVFSQGPRQCLGRHIAIVELQILISSLTRRYDMELLHPDQELLIFDRFNANPGPLPVRIKRRQVSI